MNTFSIFAMLIILVLASWILVLFLKFHKSKNNKVNAEGREGALGYKVNAESREGALGHYNQARSAEKKERKEKVLEFLKEKGKVTNNDLEALFGIADSTATTYLDELEKEGKIKQIGSEGRGVYYELING